MQTFKLSTSDTFTTDDWAYWMSAPPYPWINYEVPLIDSKPKLEVEVWNKCPACQRDFPTTFKNPTQRDFDNLAEHLNKDIPLCQECGSYYDE